MTNYVWEGSISALASNAANWQPNGTPAQGDIIIFDGTGTQNCTWDIALPASNRSVDEVIIESSFGHALVLNTNIRTKALFLNKTLTAGTADTIFFVNGSSPNFFGSHKSFGSRFVMIGDSAAYSGTINFDMNGTSGQKIKFDDGQHSSGTVTLKTTTYSPDYETPTGTLGFTYFPALVVSSGVTWAPADNIDDTDRLKEFRIDALTTHVSTFDGGMASYEFLATSGGFQIPVNDGSAYNSGDFTAKFRKMKFRATTAGHKIVMPDNRYLSLEELEIGDGVMLLGPTAIDDQGSDIRITKPPKIRGSWSFSQISPGLYRSPQHARGPMSEVKGEFTVTGKLNVTGLIDPTGMEFTAVGSNPGTDAAKTIWVNSGDSNKLYFGSSEVGGGGGGGTVDVVSNVATNTILGRNDGGSGNSEELTPAEVRTMLNVGEKPSEGAFANGDKTKLDGITAGATPTNTANVRSAGALMDDEVTNLVAVKAFDPDAYATQAQGVLANSAIQPGQYEAGSTPISAKGFIDTGTDTSWIAQSSGSRAITAANGSGSSQVFNNSATTLVTAWNQDLVETQGITYSSGIWTIDTAGIYEVHGKFGFKDGDAAGNNGLGNPSSSDFIQSIAHVLYTSDGSTPGSTDILVRGPIWLFTNGTGLTAKGCDVRTVRRFDVGDKIGFAVFNRLQSNTSTSKKYRLRSGYYNECSIRRIG
tara:strand:+ start:1866 stop:3968 length:2103 start_codon:yes stop_codon:yes gene_type:complete